MGDSFSQTELKLSQLLKKKVQQTPKTRYWFSFLRCRKSMKQWNDTFERKILQDFSYMETSSSSSSEKENLNLNRLKFIILHKNLYAPVLEKFSQPQSKQSSHFRICFDTYCRLYFSILGTLQQKVFQQLSCFPERKWNQWVYWNGQRFLQQDVNRQILSPSLSQKERNTQLSTQQKENLFPVPYSAFWGDYLYETLNSASIGITYLNKDKTIVTKIVRPFRRELFDLESQTILKKCQDNIRSSFTPLEDVKAYQQLQIDISIKKEEFDMNHESNILTQVTKNLQSFTPGLVNTLNEKITNKLNNKKCYLYKFQVPEIKIESTSNRLVMSRCPGVTVREWKDMNDNNKKILKLGVILHFFRFMFEFLEYQQTSDQINTIVVHLDPTIGNIMMDESDGPSQSLKTITISWIDWGDALLIDKTNRKQLDIFNFFCNAFKTYFTAPDAYKRTQQYTTWDTYYKKEIWKISNDLQDRIVLFRLHTFFTKFQKLFYDEVVTPYYDQLLNFATLMDRWGNPVSTGIPTENATKEEKIKFVSSIIVGNIFLYFFRVQDNWVLNMIFEGMSLLTMLTNMSSQKGLTVLETIELIKN